MHTQPGILVSPSFQDWLFTNRINKRILLIAAGLIIIQFVLFKYFYPRAGFIDGDSYVYLQTAFFNLDVNNYMVGYSRFLRLFSVFTKSDTALVAVQYLLIQGSMIFLLFTVSYFYLTSKLTQIVLLCFSVLNPLFLYLANYVSSDGYFFALSVTWFTVLLWMLHRPFKYLIVIHAILLYLAFTVRNNALIYPVIAAFAFYLSKLPLKSKLKGITLSLLLIGIFVVYTGSKFKELTGTWQYSPFSGWQLANNALYTYRYVDSANRKPVPAKFRKLDDMVRTYFDNTRDLRKYPQEAFMASTIYMWDERSPLHIYMNKQYQRDSTVEKRVKWASMGPVYGAYGSYILRQYPRQFVKYFLWPNLNKYYAPPVEFLGAYNMGEDTVAAIGQVWFGYDTKKVTSRFKDFEVNTLNFYPILSGVLNLVFLSSLVCLILSNGFKGPSFFCDGLRLMTFLWLANAFFTIFASSPALRFQAFPIVLLFCFTVLTLDAIAQAALPSPKAIAYQ